MAAALVAAATTLLGACSSLPAPPHPQQNPDPDPSAVVRSLGAVPIPLPPARPRQATAAVGRPAVLAMGEPVLVSWGAGTAVVTALGPEQLAAAGTSTRAAAPRSTQAVITLRVASTRGNLAVTDEELSSRDQTGRAIRLSPTGPRSARARAGGPAATVRVSGTFADGAAQVTWRHRGHVLAVWTFTIELDG